MGALDFGYIVRPLEGVADLRDFALEVIANAEAPGDANKGHALAVRSQVWSNSQPRIRRIAETLVRGNGSA